MNAINQSLDAVTLGSPVQHANLVMFPLIGQASKPADYLTLDEALGKGQCKITEVSESGSVPELFFENLTSGKVLLLDGEELVGAKQNRVLNLTILIAGQLKLKIPVSCVERGRWRYRTKNFASGGRTMYASARAAKTRSVTENLVLFETRASDQSEVWASVAQKSARMNAHSDSGAAEAIYETHKASVAEYEKGIALATGQVGALFAINGEIVGLDLFDAAATLKKVFGKLVTSYAIDAIDVEQQKTDCPPLAVVNAFLEHIKTANVETFKAVGSGEDLRLQSDKVVGAALQADERIVHLAAFRT